MFTKVAEGLTDRLSESSVLPLLAPALAFWFGGVVAVRWQDDESLWAWGLANLWTDEPQRLQGQVARLFALPGFEQFVVLAGVLVPSALAVDALVLPALRWAEGYLPGWLDPLRGRLLERQHRKVERARGELDQLKLSFDNHNHAERRAYGRLDEQLELRTPGAGRDIMPTRLGNVLRAAETRPKEKYGLNVLVTWPRLWLALPKDAATELTAARGALNTAMRVCLWGLLFVVWSLWAWWALPLGIAVAAASYRRTLTAAGVYGDLLESAYDVYRLELYRKVGWSEPTGEDEIERGRELTQYLWRRPQPPNPSPSVAVRSKLESSPSTTDGAERRDDVAQAPGREPAPTSETAERR